MLNAYFDFVSSVYDFFAELLAEYGIRSGWDFLYCMCFAAGLTAIAYVTLLFVSAVLS